MTTVEPETQRPEREGRARLLLVGALLALACALLWPATTGDMRNFLVPWLNTILDCGQGGAFAHPFSNYTPPYLYLLAAVSPLTSILSKTSVIKLLSLLGTGALGLAAHRLLRCTGDGRAAEGAFWLLILPTIIVNAAAMGQADAFWTAACLMAVASAIERRSLAMLLWFGVAVAFKAQAIFLAPFIGQQMLQQKVKVLVWPIPCLVYGIAMLPAAIAGWPIADLLTVYLRQAQWNPTFIGNAANPWSLVQLAAPQRGLAWLWFGDAAAAVAAVLLMMGFSRRDESDPRWLLKLALLSVLLMPFLLPKMHERFFFLADVLAFLLAWVSRDRLTIVVAVLVECGSLGALAGLLLKQPLFPVAGAVMVATAIALTFRDLLHRRPTSLSVAGQSANGVLFPA